MRPRHRLSDAAETMRKRAAILLLCGAALASLSLLGMWHGARAALAFAGYHHARYSSARSAIPREVSVRCSAAYRLYPHNYYFCVWTAEKLYYEGDAAGADAEAVRVWCDRGLDLNPHKRQLQLLKAHLLAEESPALAVEWWERYLDWQFWEPFNHVAMVHFCAQAGDFAKGREALRWASPSPHYEEARKAFQEAWQRELTAP